MLVVSQGNTCSRQTYCTRKGRKVLHAFLGPPEVRSLLVFCGLWVGTFIVALLTQLTPFYRVLGLFEIYYPLILVAL